MCDQQSLRSVCAYAQSDQSLCKSLDYVLSIKLLTEHHLEFLSLTGGCKGSSESTLVKMPHCWKSHVAAHIKEKIALLLKAVTLSKLILSTEFLNAYFYYFYIVKVKYWIHLSKAMVEVDRPIEVLSMHIQVYRENF